MSELTAAGALLKRGGVRAVAAVTNRALGAPGNNALAVTVAACAGFALAASGVARTAEPPFGAELSQVSPDLSAVRTSGADDRMPGFVQHLGQPQQDRWTEGTARRKCIGMGGHVIGQLFQEPRRPAHGDRHCRFQRRFRVGGAEDRQGRGDLADGGGCRGLHAGGLRGESGDD
ncbi:hypothetical protein AB0E04_43205 [Streptomyces sp. NPDC048251]|uniref:hypothetical protein n=1 Tax=Streptomyces sp. NPDC048251 TaxID=3154501 RepID=UPI0034475541